MKVSRPALLAGGSAVAIALVSVLAVTSQPAPQAAARTVAVAGDPALTVPGMLGPLVHTGTQQTLPSRDVSTGAAVSGERVYWVARGPIGLLLDWGVVDAATATLVPFQGRDLDRDLTVTGIHNYMEVDTGDAVAVVSGAGALTSSLGSPRSLDLGYQGDRLVIVPANNGRHSTLAYTPAPGETAAPAQLSATVFIL